MDDEQKKQDREPQKAGFVIVKRKVGESFLIGDALVVLCEIQGRQAKIAVHAPKHVRIAKIKKPEPSSDSDA